MAKINRGGRNPKEESELHSYYYGFRLDELQNIEFERLFENSGANNKSQFILPPFSTNR